MVKCTLYPNNMKAACSVAMLGSTDDSLLVLRCQVLPVYEFFFSDISMMRSWLRGRRYHCVHFISDICTIQIHAMMFPP